MHLRIPRHIVRGVYRCIVRHLNHLEPSLIKDVHRQFKRRRHSAKVGHVRAAYELEEDLRQCALGKIPLAEVIARYKGNKDQKQAIERNAMGKHHIWKSMQERRFDIYNAPPQPGTLKYSQVQVAAGLNNTRYRFLQLSNLNKNECDMTVVDTVLAPTIVHVRESKKLKSKLKREQTPRKARVISIRRDGVILHTIRIQGYKANTRGFSRLFRSLVRNRSLLERAHGLQAQLKRTSVHNEQATLKQKIAETRQKLTTNEYFRVQRQILLKRADRIQKKLNYNFRLQQQEKRAERPKRPKLRYIS